MTAAQDPAERARPVERFHPTSGGVVGYAGLALISAALVYLALAVQTVTGLRIFTGLLFVGVVVWVTQLRPRAVVYPDTLHLRNSLRDVAVPLTLVDEVSVRRMLTVWVGEDRYVCVGIGRPLRQMVKSKGSGSSTMLGGDRLDAYTRQATREAPEETAMSYPDFVETRLIELVEEARRRAAAEPGTPDAGAAQGTQPRRTWALTEIVLLLASGAVFLLSLFL